MAFNESLKAAIEAVQTTIGALTDVKKAPLTPPTINSEWPLSAAFPSEGQFSGGGNVQVVGYHNITVQLHYPQKDMQLAYQNIIELLETIVAALNADPTLGSAVTTITDRIDYSFGTMSLAGVPTVGWQFTIPVKIRYTEVSA